MKTCTLLRAGMTVLALAAGTLLSMSAAAQTAQSGWEAGKWQFAGTVYGWLPAINGKVNFPGDNGSTSIHVSPSDLLSHLKMTFQGSLDANNGAWGIYTDVVYVKLAGDKSQTQDFSIGAIVIPATAAANLSLDIKTLVLTLAGEYRVVSDPVWTVDLLGGARMLRFKPTLGYSITGNPGPIGIPLDGSKQADASFWDGLVGVKGRYTFREDPRWYAPFYLDIGAGQSKLTWQIEGGIGRSYNWGSAFAMWRYLDYHFRSGQGLENVNMNGPVVGFAFNW